MNGRDLNETIASSIVNTPLLSDSTLVTCLLVKEVIVIDLFESNTVVIVLHDVKESEFNSASSSEGILRETAPPSPSTHLSESNSIPLITAPSLNDVNRKRYPLPVFFVMFPIKR